MGRETDPIAYHDNDFSDSIHSHHGVQYGPVPVELRLSEIIHAVRGRRSGAILVLVPNILQENVRQTKEDKSARKLKARAKRETSETRPNINV